MMESNNRSRPRALVVSGFLVVAIGYLVQCIDYFSKDGFHDAVGVELFIYYLSIPLAYGITGWSWYWLTRTLPSASDDKSLRHGLRGLALQSLVIAVGTFAITNVFRTFADESVIVIGWLFVGIGGLAIAIGFWLLTTQIGSRSQNSEPLTDDVAQR